MLLKLKSGTKISLYVHLAVLNPHVSDPGLNLVCRPKKISAPLLKFMFSLTVLSLFSFSFPCMGGCKIFTAPLSFNEVIIV